MVVIDGNGIVLGRLAASVAKRLLGGESVTIINAERLIVSGDPKSVAEKYQKRRWAKDKANPEHSPHWPRKPELLVRRVVRGMLPFKSVRGRSAFRLLRVVRGAPPELAFSAQKPLDERAAAGKLRGRFTSIAELCRRLGYAG
ncbi:MAG: 50S ribosomal protein L13 [Candidatus Micrarchaeia archaeon]